MSMIECPAHDDSTASLSVAVTEEGVVLLKCHAGCRTKEDVLPAFGLEIRDLYPTNGAPAAFLSKNPDIQPSRRGNRLVFIDVADWFTDPDFTSAFDYVDENAVPKYRVVRFDYPDGKQVRQCRPNPNAPGRFLSGLNGEAPLLYRLPEVIQAAKNGGTVYVPEGEPKVELLRSWGLVATCSSGGAGKWRPEFAEHLRGAQVVILPDNDEPGRKHAADVSSSAIGKASSVRLIELEGLAEGQDIKDWAQAGGTKEELERVVGSTQPMQAPAVAPTEGPEKPFDRARYWTVVVGPRGGSKTVFEPVALAKDVARFLHLTRGPGGGLWWRDDGVYRQDGEDHVKRLVQEQLGDDFRSSRLGEVMAWAKCLPVTITTEPPPENLLHVANGVLDIDTLELRPVTPEERWTYRLPVAWNPDATCPNITAFIYEVVPEDCRLLVGEVFGMCLLPTSRFRRAVMLLGSGSNGKSKLLETLQNMLGEENIAAQKLHDLGEDRFAKAELFGKLANICGDLDSRPIERSDTFKTLTGTDLINAERKFGQPFKFVNYATLVFSANEWPVSHDQTNAYFTRWVAIPFTQRYREDGGPLQPGEKRADPKLIDRLTTPAELEGLLVRAVHGARRLRERGGFEVPESVRAAVEDYRQWADTVLAWVDERVRPDPEQRNSRSHVYGSYRTWCKDNGRGPLSAKRFWPRLREVIEARGWPVDWDTYTNDAAGLRAVEGLKVEW